MKPEAVKIPWAVLARLRDKYEKKYTAGLQKLGTGEVTLHFEISVSPTNSGSDTSNVPIYRCVGTPVGSFKANFDHGGGSPLEPDSDNELELTEEVLEAQLPSSLLLLSKLHRELNAELAKGNYELDATMRAVSGVPIKLDQIYYHNINHQEIYCCGCEGKKHKLCRSQNLNGASFPCGVSPCK